jgi:hypothetical protein
VRLRTASGWLLGFKWELTWSSLWDRCDVSNPNGL